MWHLATTLGSFSCYESPRMFGDGAEEYIYIFFINVKEEPF